MVKLVFFADLHLDAPFAWLGGSQLAARRRRQALRETLRNIVRLTREVEATALLCGGDLFEQARFTPDTIGFLERTFQEMDPIQVFLAPGNHDWYGPESPYRHAGWSSNVHVFHEDRLSAVPLKGGVTLWGGAHTAPARTLNFLDGFQAKGKGIHIALFHGAEHGAFPAGEPGHEPHAPFYAPQVEAAGLHHALVGHYHRPRDAERYTYPGNPDFLTFGEDGERGAVILNVASDGTIGRERRRVGVTEAHDLTLSISGCITQQEIRDRLTALLDERTGVARVTVEGELDPRVDLHVSDLLEVPHLLEGMQVRLGQLQPAYDLDRIVDEPTVRGQFVRDVMDAVLDEDDRRRVLLVGLRALEGRGDLEPLA